MMEDDELELDKLGDRKTALFCIVSDVDTTFNFIAAMVYTQMFNGNYSVKYSITQKSQDKHGSGANLGITTI